MHLPDSSQNDDSTQITPQWYGYILTPLGVSSVLALILANGLWGWYAFSNRGRDTTVIASESSSKFNSPSSQPQSNLVKPKVESTSEQSNQTNSIEAQATIKPNNQSALVETLLPASVRLPQLQTSISDFEQLISAGEETEGLFYLLAPYRYDYLKIIDQFESPPALEIVKLNGTPQIYWGAYTQTQAEQLLEQLQDKQISAYIYSQ